MPKIKIDYSNTIFYKIYCIDEVVNELYIGHTTNFVQRKHAHKQSCINEKSPNYKLKLYDMIRKNKGWDNWKMEIIAFHDCNNLLLAKKYEQQYYEQYKATLNSIEPLPKKEPLYCNICNIFFHSTREQEIHNSCKKHLNNIFPMDDTMVTNGDKKVPKSSKNYYCEKCDFKCSRKSQYDRHILTLKHTNGYKMVTNGDKQVPKSAEFECECGNTYQHRQGLYRHKKTCSIIQGEENQTIVHNQINNSSLTEKMIELVMSKNQEFLGEFMNKMVHIMPSINNTNTNSNNTNTTNNQFNITMFLNEQCKNAMNISDFIKSLPITAQHYENTKNNGLTDTLANMMVDGLNNMEIVERPIHCTDQKRKVMYVKDNDKWERDNNHKIITKNVTDLAKIQRTMVKLWQEENPNFKTVDSLQTDFTNILFNLFTSVEESKKDVSKILKAVTDITYLDDDMKQQLI